MSKNNSRIGKVSLHNGCVTVKLDLRAYNERLERAQYLLGEQVLASCRSLMPMSTGTMQQLSRSENKPLVDRSCIRDGGKQVVFPGPYARYLYNGKVMIDRETGKGPRKIPTSPGEYILRFRKGAKLVETDRPLTYSNPRAVPKWFEVAKQRDAAAWVKTVAHTICGDD